MARPQSVGNRMLYRIYEDYFMPSRLGHFERLLQRLLVANYEFLTVEQFARRVEEGKTLPKLLAVLRHDVDHDNRTARAMHELEAGMGIAASFYFRLCTIDVELMQRIAARGSEASYHFEEIATIAKRRTLRDAAAAYRHIDEAQELFRRNLSRLRAQTGLAMRVVASHGDFINRRLNVANHQLLTPALRRELNVLAEVYDDRLRCPVTTRVSDCQPPHFWQPTSPDDAIDRRSPCIYLLVHPKHWRVNVRTNVRASATRLWEGISYEVRKRIA